MSAPRSHYMREIFVSHLQDASYLPQTTSYVALEEQARKKLTPEAYGYVAGSASSENTNKSNMDAMQDWQIVPRMLAGVDLDNFDMSTTLFGRKFATPFVISPIGVQGQLHVDSDRATARAACKVGVPFTLSSATSTPLEVVAQEGGFAKAREEAEGCDGEVSGAEPWFQLYWPSDDDITRSLLDRAKKSGYKVLVVTLDTWSLGWRPRDLDIAYNPFLKGNGLANLFCDPVFVEKYCEGKSPLRKDTTEDDVFQAALACISLLSPGNSRSWADLPLLRELWGASADGHKIVLKGIQSVTDAARAIEAGADGIWVSNHGGRQVDGALGSLSALAPIARYVRSSGCALTRGGERPTLIFDSGVRTGADAMKALCLGADAVGIGRPYAYALALGGEQGVECLLKAMLADLELNTALAGCRGVKEMGSHLLVRRGEESKL
ncbi:FMN-dependent alpha-hydroxy acid dehydrogenase [Tilletiaria anomala UBC 951]|uniref:FMN-dependent alpha-hydroxy acid dehydrogenase n=1 Tax=Tilletiaria anomala (strain ATCC 24038 / CBS 436.72 / UBC 951) TaxID=1037660 RepID=A0A066W2A0_TILAU|nr:FMN-dependent alpha-hydroxy acid dehydrogenase [Tilletiaria anomala UBC 951]KDN44880.1 FMN-dependent alpha-hydroxy acid dehydrogenase [Tilletiaria anomala UBC 951]